MRAIRTATVGASRAFPDVPAAWRNDALAEKWRKVRQVRRVVTGALEIERAAKRIGSSLEAHPFVHVSDPDLFAALLDVDLAEVSITSGAVLVEGEGPPDAFRLRTCPAWRSRRGLPQGRKCARSWKILPTVGLDPPFRTSRRATPKRCANGMPCARRPSSGRLGTTLTAAVPHRPTASTCGDVSPRLAWQSRR